jgi:hypothetical protein
MTEAALLGGPFLFRRGHETNQRENFWDRAHPKLFTAAMSALGH